MWIFMIDQLISLSNQWNQWCEMNLKILQKKFLIFFRTFFSRWIWFQELEMDGLPNLRILKNWTLVGLHCYLFFSLNFVGVFANEYPPRITSSFSRVSASKKNHKQEVPSFILPSSSAVSLFSLLCFCFSGSAQPVSSKSKRRVSSAQCFEN